MAGPWPNPATSVFELADIVLASKYYKMILISYQHLQIGWFLYKIWIFNFPEKIILAGYIEPLFLWQNPLNLSSG